jgi:peptidyl-tRNA hydrolase, PTH1 family
MLIVGLGNPGSQYEWTRHNLGFLLVDLLARQLNASEIKRSECRALIGQVEIEGRRVELVKPQTYMNLSGEAVACLVHKRELKISKELLVICDDLALPFGSIRLRPSGSSGGHNGLKSIIASIKTDEFIRLRIGIRPDHPISNTKSFVLDQFPQAGRAEVEKVLERSAEAIRSLLKDGVDKTMSLYNK